MKKFLITAALAGVPLLAGCHSAAPPEARESGGTAKSANADEGGTRYRCADGSVVDAVYPDTDTARIVYKGKSITMKVAVSASGARYTGGGWEWWTKGLKDGRLTPLPPGEEIAPPTGIDCTAESGSGY